ncbi:MAG: hypothetical protein DWQ37_00985 [Planctomycetota bacterium]|nr:MAG: hypothetical protein DWQ37_00985 [Planctomycetota bacterium]
MRVNFVRIAVLCAAVVSSAPAFADEKLPQAIVVTLGDSITKGVRPGVAADETFAHLVGEQLRAEHPQASVTNVGIGGERTDQALERLDDVIALRPRVVTVMYGTNDSYVDQGKTESRLTLEQFRANLRTIVERLLRAGIEPVLMTEPRWAKAGKNGLGENPNGRLESFVEATRQIADECDVPLVDHYAHWTRAETNGQDLDDWTTDHLHPNPRGHEVMAATMLPALLAALASDVNLVDFKIQLDTVLEHDDQDFLWFHPRAAAVPSADPDQPPVVWMTLQKHLRESDYYSGASVMRTDDLGRTWSTPEARPELDWVRDGDVDVSVADITPFWHPATKKLIAVGAQVRYSPQGQQLDDETRAHQTAYAVFDPAANSWTRWRRLEMPEDETFHFARSACAQGVVEADGTLLLPFYIGRNSKEPFSSCVVRCTFDGDKLSYQEHGDVLALDVARGLYEPSLVKCGKRYYLTLRNDHKAYVTAGDDGLHYRPAKAWTFDDGQELGSYNTQQHWLAPGDALFLVYTRRGANNDHVMRHRAPLFIAQVHPQKLHVLRASERVLVPERGATLGNFGASAITTGESWVTVAEGVWNDEARRRGATGALFVARILWQSTNP